MFFFLSKTISFLIKPPTLIILSFVLSIASRNERRRKRFFWIGLSLLLVFTNEFISNTAIGVWEVGPKEISKLDNYEYGVVLGGMVDLMQEPRDRVYFNQSVDRVLHTIKLYRSGKIQKIVITGGSGSIYDQEIKEGLVLKDFLLENGVSENDLMIESESRNTYENAVFTSRIIPPAEAGKILLITSGTHMRRGAACFRKAGYDIETFPTSFRHDDFRPHMIYTPSSDSIREWDTLFKEVTGYVVYWLVGYL